MDFTAILPDTTDALTAPHWQALREGRIEVQRCDMCGYLRWPPAERCPECLGTETSWQGVSGSGALWSFTTYHRSLHPAFGDLVPYSVGLIDLHEGVQMIGRLAVEEDRLCIGMPLVARFREESSDVTLVEWYEPHEEEDRS